jgi:hypothetical protein
VVDVRCRPIDHWSGPHTPWDDRRRASFSAGWARILNDLERELDHLDATDVVIGLKISSRDIRLDGWPKGNATVPPPVSFTMQTRHGPLRFQCDRWDHWRANLRAIGLTLQRLRLVDEGGCTRSGEQYRGWGELPAGTPMDPAMTVDEASRFIVEHAWDGVVDREGPLSGVDLDVAYRTAAKRCHPDNGGDPADMIRLNKARAVLEAHSG